MTFTEAAAQVLRLVGKPLHYKEITDVAIEKNLLSHVGKSPEVTMGARLAALVKKGEKDNPLIRVRPGVFALREWDQKVIEQGLADRTPALEILAANGGDAELREVARADSGSKAIFGLADPEDEEEQESGGTDQEDVERLELAVSATELFEPEDDDDQPIFGKLSPPPPAEETREEERLEREAGTRRRRRRRRRGRGADDARASEHLPSYTVSDAPSQEAVEVEPREEARADATRPDARAPERGREPPAQVPIEELVGRELADAVASLLGGHDRNAGPVSAHRLAEEFQRKGRVTSDLGHVQSLILASVRADNVRRQADGQRPRFRVISNRVGLTDWALDDELVRIERELLLQVERYREATRRVLIRRLQQLPQRAFGELVLLLLERLGFGGLVTVQRPGGSGSELHLSGCTSGPFGEMRVAVVVRRDGREVGRERVTELRGALHHYGPAHAGWIITTGQVLSGAREEAAAPGAAPVSLVDGQRLARLCEEHGIAVQQTRLLLPVVDIDLLEALRNG